MLSSLWSFLALVFPSDPSPSVISTLSSNDPAPLVAPLPEPPPFHCGACGFGSGETFIYTLPAESMQKGRWAFALRADLQKFDAFSDSELTNKAAQGIFTHSIDQGLAVRAGAAHALSDTWTVGADLPFIHNTDLREGSDEGGTAHVEDNGDQSGLGDLSLFTQWRFYGDVQSSTYASLYLGVKLPTGDTNERGASGDLLEPDHQPGSGSTDPFLGVAMSKSLGTSTLGFSVLGQLAGHASQDSNLGNVLRANLGWGWSSNQPSPDSTLWRWMLEMNAQWHEKSTIDGDIDPNSGGTQVFLSPGVRVTWPSHVSWFAGVGVPLLQNLDGDQSKTDFRASTGVGFSF